MSKKHQKLPIQGLIPTGQKLARTSDAVVPSGTKTPRIASEPASYMSLKAAWRVSRIQLIDPYGWHELTAPELLSVQSKLAAFESMTFGEIFVRDKKRNHEIDVETIPNKIVRQWLEENMPDRPALKTLRLTGAQRVWGYLAEGAYQIVFWDPNHEIFPSLK